MEFKLDMRVQVTDPQSVLRYRTGAVAALDHRFDLVAAWVKMDEPVSERERVFKERHDSRRDWVLLAPGQCARCDTLEQETGSPA